MKDIDLSDFKDKKIALVLSGGVVKAASWHLGVSLALEDLGFTFKNNKSEYLDEGVKPSIEIGTYVGSSAGTMISIFLACGYTPQEIINGVLGLDKSNLKRLSYKDMFYLNKSILNQSSHIKTHDPFSEFPFLVRKMLKPLLNFSGPFTTEGVKKYLLENVLESDNFEDFIPDLFIVGTQLDQSQKTIFSRYNYPNPSHDNTASYDTNAKISDAAAASMSVPPFYAPYPIYNPITQKTNMYIDGEIRETLSTHVAEDNNCDVVISSWTHTPYHFQEEVGSLSNYGLPYIAIQSIYLLIQKKIVAARARRSTAEDILTTVNEYMLKEKFSNKHRRDILNILENRLSINIKTKLIDIYPDHDDYKLFFSNSFSLNPEVAAHAVKMGYKKTMQVLSHY